MPADSGGTAPRSAERASAERIYFTLAALIGGVIGVYFLVVPVFDLNIAFHFYLMLWITMASAFNVAAGFSGYMPFGFVAFYGVGAFATAILVKSLGFPVLLALPFSGAAGCFWGCCLRRHCVCRASTSRSSAWRSPASADW